MNTKNSTMKLTVLRVTGVLGERRNIGTGDVGRVRLLAGLHVATDGTLDLPEGPLLHVVRDRRGVKGHLGVRGLLDMRGFIVGLALGALVAKGLRSLPKIFPFQHALSGLLRQRVHLWLIPLLIYPSQVLLLLLALMRVTQPFQGPGLV